jgi:hypothetical protein
MSLGIVPEITEGQSFFQIIKSLASDTSHCTMLEIGSSNGLGSTQAFLQGIASRSDQDRVRLCCLELAPGSFQELVTNMQGHAFVTCYQESSTAVADLPVWEDVAFFYATRQTCLNDYPLETVRGWYDMCLNYARASGHDANGIARIKAEQKIRNFDLVLIDGSEFTGEQDLYSVIGARTIILDDCMTYKCYTAYQVLAAHPSYRLVIANMAERHGFVVFKRLF